MGWGIGRSLIWVGTLSAIRFRYRLYGLDGGRYCSREDGASIYTIQLRPSDIVAEEILFQTRRSFKLSNPTPTASQIR